MTGEAVTVRRAGAGDVAELVGLRALMFEAMGYDPGGQDAPWRHHAAAWFRERLAQPAVFAAFVAERPGHGVVGGAAGTVEARTPSPRSPGPHGHLFNVATRPGHRRAGIARRCTVAVLAWFEADTAVSIVELDATGAGAPLYRSLGFDDTRYPSMQLRLPDRG